MPHRDAAAAVLIIGGGAAGLSTAAALTKRGIGATVLDRDEQIGGSWARRYRSLRLHTLRRYSGLAHYPVPGNRPRYLSKDEYAAYLKEYAEAFGLDVRLGEDVQAVQSSRGGRERWEVLSSAGTREARAVVVATGLAAQPCRPTWQGIESFAGTVLHSADYRSADAFEDRSVLVVGLGNSGAEIAADLAANGAASVAVSVRTPPPIVTREMFGVVPVQLLGIALTPLGIPAVVDRCSEALRPLGIGDLRPYGLGPAAWGPFTAQRPAVIDTGFLKELKAQRIAIRPDIARCDGQRVVYADGSTQAIDAIVAATGFRTGLEKILSVPGLIDDNGRPRFASGRETAAPGLYFVGFDETVRGQLFEINRQSRRVAAGIERYLAHRIEGA